MVSLIFPPVEQDLPHNNAQPESQVKTDSESSSSAEVLAAKLPDPPTADPRLEGQPETKRKKVNSEDLESTVELQPEDYRSRSDYRSEDDWEEVDKTEGGPTERLDDEPIEIDRASAADVHSVQSSGIIERDDPQIAVNMLTKDW